MAAKALPMCRSGRGKRLGPLHRLTSGRLKCTLHGAGGFGNGRVEVGDGRGPR